MEEPLTDDYMIYDNLLEVWTYKKEDVQSAKRLLKYNISFKSAFIEHMTSKQKAELMDIIDACFQIDEVKKNE